MAQKQNKKKTYLVPIVRKPESLRLFRTEFKVEKIPGSKFRCYPLMPSNSLKNIVDGESVIIEDVNYGKDSNTTACIYLARIFPPGDTYTFFPVAGSLHRDDGADLEIITYSQDGAILQVG